VIAPSEPSLEELDVLPEVADQFQVAFGLDTPPATLAEWVDATSPLVQTATFQERFDHRFRTSSSRHQISAPERDYYIGLFDTLLVPFIRGDVREFTIRSESPVSERVMEVQVDAGEPSIAPDDAVMSFGVATDVVSAEYFEVPPISPMLDSTSIRTRSGGYRRTNGGLAIYRTSRRCGFHYPSGLS